MDDALTKRVEALERAVTEGERDLSGLANDGEALDKIDRLEHRQDELEERVAELEAATQALRGYVGNVRAVNEEIENRAETALAKVESLEATVSPRGEGQSTDSETTEPRQDDGRQELRHGQSATQRPNTGHSTVGKQPRSRGGKGEAGESRDHAGTDRCSACGRTQSGAGSSPGGPTRGSEKTDSHIDSPGELDGGSIEQLRENEPLISEETGESGGALSRFKRLL